MSWKRKLLNDFKLYAITDLKGEDPEILTKIKEALRGGVDVIQLRSKQMSDQALLALGKKIRQLTAPMKKLFIVNDRIDLMLALGADGVHLGQEDIPVKIAREMVKDKSKLIGCSTHSLKQAAAAVKEGADYIGFGPIFATPTKPDYPPVGFDLIKKVIQKSRIPVVCIGGINQSNTKAVAKAGANRIAVVRAIFSSEHPFHAARELKRMMTS